MLPPIVEDDAIVGDDDTTDPREAELLAELEEAKAVAAERNVKVRVNLDVRRTAVLRFRRVSSAVSGTRGDHMAEALNAWCDEALA